jgi:hypothetical protein
VARCLDEANVAHAARTSRVLGMCVLDGDRADGCCETYIALKQRVRVNYEVSFVVKDL